MNYGLHLRRSDRLNITGFCDADWGFDPDDRKSALGYCIFLGSNLISGCFKKQNTVSRSSTEAEFRSLASIVAEVTWLTSLLEELQVKITTLPEIWCDNLSTIQLSTNPILRTRTKYVEMDLYFVREKVANKQLEVRHVPSVDQTTDIFTKALSSSRFFFLRDKLRVESSSTLSLREDVRS